MNAQQLIQALELEAHIEGGFYRRTYQADTQFEPANLGSRPLMTSIYYLLCKQSPIGYLHRNRSDILHYYHGGSAIDYWLLSPAGELQHFTLGFDLAAGQQLQLTVPGGYWKASQLRCEANNLMQKIVPDYGLISEAVSPGFDYRDMELAQASVIKEHYSEHWVQIRSVVKDNERL